MKREELEQKLEELNEDARANIIVNLVGCKVDVPKDYILEAMHFYEENRGYGIAAYLAEKQGMNERARELNIREMEEATKRGLYAWAGHIAEKIELFNRAFQIYEKGGNLDCAIKLAEKLGLKGRAEVYKEIKKDVD